MTERVETTILRNLLFNDEYCRKVLPFINPEYFENSHERIIFEEIGKFIVSYQDLATKEVLLIETEKRTDLSEHEYPKLCKYIQSLDDSHVDLEWLLDTTEMWCRDRAIYKALIDSIRIADGEDDSRGRDSIPTILQEALGVSFDQNIGHDLIEDYERRFEYYTRVEEKLPFDLEYFNRITGGGLSRKTVFLVMSPPNAGKSLTMCSFASSFLAQGKNVLYISMEMAEEKIAQRIDANLLNVNISDLKNLPREKFETRIIKLAQKTHGKLIIKEYPTSSAHMGHFKALLSELKLKKHFIPDVIFIDYLNICASSRYKKNANVNSYTYIKSVIEEMRALAVEHNVPIVSATQSARSGATSSDPDMTDVSESFGTMMTADIAVALIKTEELDNMGQIMFKQIRNRDNDVTMHKRFVVGVDKHKMRLYDVEQDAQVEAIDTSSDNQYNYEDDNSSSRNQKFSKFKFD
jgi:replicative DNA helicase